MKQKKIWKIEFSDVKKGPFLIKFSDIEHLSCYDLADEELAYPSKNLLIQL